MPYVDKEARARLSNADNRARTPGELNYAITELVINYIELRPLNYATFNEVMGAMAAAQAEFYRRVITPYEDVKKKENGDVYPDWLCKPAIAKKEVKP